MSSKLRQRQHFGSRKSISTKEMILLPTSWQQKQNNLLVEASKQILCLLTRSVTVSTLFIVVHYSLPVVAPFSAKQKHDRSLQSVLDSQPGAFQLTSRLIANRYCFQAVCSVTTNAQFQTMRWLVILIMSLKAIKRHKQASNTNIEQ